MWRRFDVLAQYKFPKDPFGDIDRRSMPTEKDAPRVLRHIRYVGRGAGLSRPAASYCEALQFLPEGGDKVKRSSFSRCMIAALLLFVCMLSSCSFQRHIDGEYTNANGTTGYSFTKGERNGGDYGGTGSYSGYVDRDFRWTVKNDRLSIDGKGYIIDGDRLVDPSSLCDGLHLSADGTKVIGKVSLKHFFDDPFGALDKSKYISREIVFYDDGTFEHTSDQNAGMRAAPYYYTTTGQYYIQEGVLVAGDEHRFVIVGQSIYGVWFEKRGEQTR